MIEISFRKTKLSFSFSFFAVIAILVCFRSRGLAMAALLASLLHELGHLVAMQLFNVRITRLLFYGGGIKIFKEQERLVSHKADILILFAGSTFNFIIAVVMIFLGGDFEKAMQFSACNLIIGAYNLLPFKYFDGGAILSHYTSYSSSYCKVCLISVLRIFLSFFILAISILLVLNDKANISLLITTLYIAISEIFSS